MNLTHSQKSIVSALASGLTTKEIAGRIGSTEKDVYQRIRRAKKRLGFDGSDARLSHCIAKITVYAVRTGLITIGEGGKVLTSYFNENLPHIDSYRARAAARSLPDTTRSPVASSGTSTATTAASVRPTPRRAVGSTCSANRPKDPEHPLPISRRRL